MAISFQVQVQGMDPDLKNSTGKYEPIDLGTVGPGRLAEILKAISQMKMPAGLDRGEDVCAPSIIVKGPRGLFQSNLANDDGEFYCDDLDGNIGISQIMMVVTGEKWNIPDVKQASQAEMKHTGKCSACGEKLDAGDEFCAGCGAKTTQQSCAAAPKKDRPAKASPSGRLAGTPPSLDGRSEESRDCGVEGVRA